LPSSAPADVGISSNELSEIDSIAQNAIHAGATPGCVVLLAKDGKIVYHKAFGHFTYDKTEPVTVESVYDMASVTKVCATTMAIMKLYEEGKIDLTKRLGDYLPMVKGTNKERLNIENILLHQAGLTAFIPFYKETIDTAGLPLPTLYAAVKNDSFSIGVAENLFLKKEWNDSMYSRILQSPLGSTGKYVYSDNDFIFLGKMAEQLTGMPLDKYVRKEFYQPMALTTAGFKPKEYMPVNKIVPTEKEPVFRRQLLRGDVHDPGAAMFAGVAGHAGLFSNAYDMACIMQLLLNGGTFNGKRYLQQETIELFTGYHSNASRRGLGFDKPEKDNYKRPEPYPCLSASPATFGHTGFTGTCVWADPKYNLVYIFLSNRVSPDFNNTKLLKMNVRSMIQEAVYKAMGAAKAR
jgi:beta-N-acetylhexosaminidase